MENRILDNKNQPGEEYISKDTNDAFFEEPNLSHIKKSLKELRGGKGTAHELLPDEPYLENILNDIKTGKAHFAEHELIED